MKELSFYSQELRQTLNDLGCSDDFLKWCATNLTNHRKLPVGDADEDFIEIPFHKEDRKMVLAKTKNIYGYKCVVSQRKTANDLFILVIMQNRLSTEDVYLLNLLLLCLSTQQASLSAFV